MNDLSNEVKAQLFKQESEDPFLVLLTITGEEETFRLVNNSTNIVSRGEVFNAFPMKVRLPVDDGESSREFNLELDNSSLALISALRSVTEPLPCKIEMILASIPDVVQMSVEDLLIRSITYNSNKIIARIILDNFLSVGIPSEKYTPSLYPGMF